VSSTGKPNKYSVETAIPSELQNLRNPLTGFEAGEGVSVGELRGGTGQKARDDVSRRNSPRQTTEERVQRGLWIIQERG
jgi:hypothetical protein